MSNKKVLIALEGGLRVLIPIGFEYSTCKCGADDIVWGVTEKNKKNIPVRWDDVKGWITHFEDCPLADKFRKKKGGI